MRRFVRPNQVEQALSPYRACVCTIEQRTLRFIQESQSHVIPLYDLEKASAFDGVSQTGLDFVVARLAAGASEVRDLIIDAWRASATSSVGFPAINIRDAEDGNIVSFEGISGLD